MKLTKQYNNWRFMVTSACNANCVFCHKDGTHAKSGFLDINLFESLVRKYEKSITKVRFSGGEPLLHPDIFKMIHRTVRLTNNVGIATNGTQIQKHYESIIKSGLPRMNISLHTISPITYSRITKLSVQQHKDILAIIPLIKKHLTLRINAVIMKGVNTNKKELMDLLGYAVDNQINLEFIELDLGAIHDIDYKKYHYPPQQLVNNIQDIYKTKFVFDEAEGRWEATINKSQIGVHLGLCTNKLCHICIKTRPILVYPNGTLNRCRLNNPVIKSIDVGL